MLDNLNSELSGNARKIIVMLIMGEKSESPEVCFLLKFRCATCY